MASLTEQPAVFPDKHPTKTNRQLGKNKNKYHVHITHFQNAWYILSPCHFTYLGTQIILSPYLKQFLLSARCLWNKSYGNLSCNGMDIYEKVGMAIKINGGNWIAVAQLENIRCHEFSVRRSDLVLRISDSRSDAIIREISSAILMIVWTTKTYFGSFQQNMYQVNKVMQCIPRNMCIRISQYSDCPSANVAILQVNKPHQFAKNNSSNRTKQNSTHIYAPTICYQTAIEYVFTWLTISAKIDESRKYILSTTHIFIF